MESAGGMGAFVQGQQNKFAMQIELRMGTASMQYQDLAKLTSPTLSVPRSICA